MGGEEEDRCVRVGRGGRERGRESQRRRNKGVTKSTETIKGGFFFSPFFLTKWFHGALTFILSRASRESSTVSEA